MMNAWRKALGLGGILALLATANAGCVASFEPDEVIDEANDELSATGGSGNDDADGDGEPAGGDTSSATIDIVPDPLPWHELMPALDRGGEREGPDPLPWVPGTVSAGSPGTGTHHDGE